MKNYHDQYMRTEELDWQWSFDSKSKTHTLKLTYLPTNQSVSGSIAEARGRNPLYQRKRELHDSLNEQLEKLVFGE